RGSTVFTAEAISKGYTSRPSINPLSPSNSPRVHCSMALGIIFCASTADFLNVNRQKTVISLARENLN
ncbi:hypothetical protein, partial [Proteus mirabilis]|uniref:hypothetical protein n=1 Tax=Proteus mirabilis TaxID=584 RepID=UPI00313A9045